MPISPALRFGGFNHGITPQIVNTDYNLQTDEYAEARVDMQLIHRFREMSNTKLKPKNTNLFEGE